MTAVPRLDVIGITGVPEVRAGDPLGRMLCDAAAAQGTPLLDGDVLVVTQKVVSKAEGRVVKLSEVEPSAFATKFAAPTGRDPRLVELVLRESRSLVRADADRGIIISETHHGFVCANAGIDLSNLPEDGTACLLPLDSDRSAARLRSDIAAGAGDAHVAVVISDTFGRPWREGHVNFAIGVSGIEPTIDYRGLPDANGRILKVTTIASADELAAAAELVTAKTINVPAAIMRGLTYVRGEGGIGPLLRERSRDLFR